MAVVLILILCLPRTVEHLGILTGAQLFSLNREELKKVCGDEGNRVYSKITVEKNQLEVSSCLGKRMPVSAVLDVPLNKHFKSTI